MRIVSYPWLHLPRQLLIAPEHAQASPVPEALAQLSLERPLAVSSRPGPR